MLESEPTSRDGTNQVGACEPAGFQEFQRLAAEWRSESRYLASPTAIAQVAAYQQIIAMGRPAVPLILAELSREPDHWFVALKRITGENPPIPPEAQGNLTAMAQVWVEWGQAHGIRV